MTKLSKELMKELGLFDQRKAGLGHAAKPVPEGCRGPEEEVGWLPETLRLGPTAACDRCGIFAFVGPFLQKVY